ncbi:hypothetical protein CDD80_2747 [Ophiocordyceps camponoti-rufipedis]|uniref:FAM192A/Fyv6 N-terminal domain-containing protein n=1 Tax=Ophiocordyceps camponoti-rufipedis TaxID=2004952 RepID=A0A2C5Z4L8_9HYPO|nr:hypothetical protein CDD80_2747 [Ophiocordyceps camponoti-rufipedis]
MADRFVSGGTIGDEPKSTDERRPSISAEGHKAEWESVQRELAAERKRREEARVKAAGGEEKSLYDILQANKGALILVE